MSEEKSTKLGLALSGGGFRASFFHIGILASMAKSGLLRQVEVISTVSGGSIIGALYYLHVKKLLEEKADIHIKDEDYQEIIAKIEVDFLQAVQRNFRLRTFLNPLKNLKMSLPNYSRSDHIGELYDKFLYQKVLDSNNTEPIKMKDLKIKPCGESASFHPLKDNKSRNAKVPILLINATVLNNGHNWRFCASDMGETNIDEQKKKYDKNFTLKRPESYQNIYKHGDFKLGLAVAASACLPGVFAPLAISNLYDEKIRVQLVDGGANDNQGIIGLLDNELKCTHFIISDASGPLKDDKDPGVQAPRVLIRTNSIFMDRIREQQLSKILKEHPNNVAHLHLKKGAPVMEFTYFNEWNNLQGESVSSATEPPSQTFGVNEEVQTLLSHVRTDLDSFSDIEAFSLMYDGYKICQYEFNKTHIKNLVTNNSLSEKEYLFFKIEKWISSPAIDPYYKKLLETASRKFFRVVRTSKLMQFTIFLVAFLCAILVIKNYGTDIIQWAREPMTKGNILLIFIILIFLFAFYLSRYKFLYHNLIARFCLSDLPTALVSMIGSVIIGIYLLTFDRLFLHLGRIKMLERAQKSQ